ALATGSGGTAGGDTASPPDIGSGHTRTESLTSGAVDSAQLATPSVDGVGSTPVATTGTGSPKHPNVHNHSRSGPPKRFANVHVRHSSWLLLLLAWLVAQLVGAALAIGWLQSQTTTVTPTDLTGTSTPPTTSAPMFTTQEPPTNPSPPPVVNPPISS